MNKAHTGTRKKMQAEKNTQGAATQGCERTWFAAERALHDASCREPDVGRPFTHRSISVVVINDRSSCRTALEGEDKGDLV